MKTVTRVIALSVLAGLGLFQIATGDAQADGKTKKVMETSEKAPKQPTKPVTKTEDEWKKLLSPEQFYILRKHGTERPWGKVYDEFKKQGEGTYFCAGCDAELFTSKEKFDARCGWPAFFDASKHENIKTIKDTTGGMLRVEVRCKVCNGHLGHVFSGEGFNTPTDQRYCINGKVLKFVPKKEKSEKDAGGKKPDPKPSPSKEKE